MWFKDIIASLVHTSVPVSSFEKFVSAMFALSGVLLTALLSSSIGHSAQPLIITSMGASCVLLFAAPHSPMAQPWSFIGGHLISAIVGVTCFKFIPNIYLAGSAAVGLAIFAMHWSRCLHPPGGATALAMVLGSQEVHALGYQYMLMPIGLNVVILMLLALALNKLLPGRRYPMALTAPSKAEATPAALTFGRAALSKEDIESALKDMNAYIDVTEQDLEKIYSHASLHNMRRKMGEVYCRDIMTSDVVTAEYGDELAEVWERMRQRKLKGVPIIDRARRVVGIVTIVDFLKRADTQSHSHFIERIRGFIQRTTGLTSIKPEVVGQIMSAPAMTANEDDHIVSLIPIFSEHNIHHLPIVNKEKRIVGMVTQTDLTVALYRYWAAMP